MANNVQNYEDMVCLEVAAKRVVEEKTATLKEHEIDLLDKWIFPNGRYEIGSGWFTDNGKNNWQWAAMALLWAAQLAYTGDKA